jgi:Zn-dependent protease
MEVILQLFFLFFSVVIHECAHGWIAYLRGDSTAKEEGRLTLNPLPHIDPFGTVIWPLLQWFTAGHVFFAYAKPVPVNSAQFKNPRRDILWVGLAGPASNFLLGLISGVLVRFYLDNMILLPKIIVHPLIMFSILNMWLAFVNLIPVPPLDGSRILAGLLPRRFLPVLFQIERVGIFVILLLIFTDFFGKCIAPLVQITVKWITGLP